MSDRDPKIHNDHADRWNDDLAAYALDALEPAERAALVEHLAGCPICTERLRWMAPAVDVLPATVAPQQPPEALKSRLMDVVQRESSMIESAADPGRAARSERAGDRRGRARRGLAGLSLRPVLAGLGVFLLLAAGVAGYAIRDGGSGSGSTQVYAAKGPTRDSIASGSLEVDGDAGSLHVANLPATGRGEVYQAWIQDIGRGRRGRPPVVGVRRRRGRRRRRGDSARSLRRPPGDGHPRAPGRQRAPEREPGADRGDGLIDHGAADRTRRRAGSALSLPATRSSSLPIPGWPPATDIPTARPASAARVAAGRSAPSA